MRPVPQMANNRGVRRGNKEGEMRQTVWDLSRVSDSKSESPVATQQSSNGRSCLINITRRRRNNRRRRRSNIVSVIIISWRFLQVLPPQGQEGEEEKEWRRDRMRPWELSRGWKIHYLFPGSGGWKPQIDSIRRRQEIAKRI
jgi:hypothetical protein